MSTFRIAKRENPFVQLDKFFIMDESLSFKSKGILAYLLSRPDDWQVYESEIMKHASDGRSSVRAGIKELIDHGYIERALKHGEKGRFAGYEYFVFERPSDRVRFSDNGKSDIGESHTTNNELTDINKTNKKEYVFLEKDDHPLIAIYLEHFEERFKRKHKKVTVDAYEEIMRCVREAEEIEEYDFETGVIEHFNELPKSNDGSMLPFTKTFMRRYTVQTYI